MFFFLDAPATLMLLLVIVLVSGYALTVRADLVQKLALQPRRVVADGEYYRMASAWLIHGGIGHLAINLFTLFAFGPAVEALLGTAAFLAVFFGAELAASGLTVLLKKESPSYASVGASGAISGILFSYSLYRPTDLIYLFAALPIPAWLFAVGFVAASIYAMKRAEGGGGIAHEAHLGGALGGIIVTILLDPGVVMTFLRQMGLG